MFDLVSDFYSLVNSPSWVNYPTIPADYKDDSLPASPYLRVSVVFGKADRVAYSNENKKQLDGMILVQIVTESGRGQLPAATIGSELDDVLEDTYVGSMQTKLSSLQFIGMDKKDTTKSIYQYSVPFTYFGE